MAENFNTVEENRKFLALRDLESSGKLDEIGLASTDEQKKSGNTPVNNLIHKYGALTFDLVAEAIYEPSRLIESLGQSSTGDVKADTKAAMDILLNDQAVPYDIVAQAIGMDEATAVKYIASQRTRDNNSDFNKEIAAVADTRSVPDETRGLNAADEPELDPLFFNVDKFDRRVDDHEAQKKAEKFVEDFRAKRAKDEAIFIEPDRPVMRIDTTKTMTPEILSEIKSRDGH